MPARPTIRERVRLCGPADAAGELSYAVYCVGGNAIIFEAGFAHAAGPVKFPVMPRADNVLAVQVASAKRSAGVIASI